ncbi:MAG: hypothetical protein COW04_04375, partial [Deltaproteobacteria bacterium CG12_big_fil_rev_8_21_14_0_65_43_10]
FFETGSADVKDLLLGNYAEDLQAFVVSSEVMKVLYPERTDGAFEVYPWDGIVFITEAFVRRIPHLKDAQVRSLSQILSALPEYRESLRRSEVRAGERDSQSAAFKRWVARARLLIRNHGTYILQLSETSPLSTPERLKAGKLFVDLNQQLSRMRIVPVQGDNQPGLSLDFTKPTVFIYGPDTSGQHVIEGVARTLVRAAHVYNEFKKHPEWQKLPADKKNAKNAELALQADMAISQVRKKIRGQDTEFALLDDLVEEQVMGWLDPDGSIFAEVQARQGKIDAEAQAEYEAAVRSGQTQPHLPEAMRVYFALLQLDFAEHHQLEQLGQSISGFELELSEALNTQIMPDQKDPVPELLAGLINAMSAVIRKEKVPVDEPLQVLLDESLAHLLARQITEALRIYILSQYWQGDDLFQLQNRLALAVTQIDPDLQLYTYVRHSFLLEEIQKGLQTADISVEAAEK